MFGRLASAAKAELQIARMRHRNASLGSVFIGTSSSRSTGFKSAETQRAFGFSEVGAGFSFDSNSVTTSGCVAA